MDVQNKLDEIVSTVSGARSMPMSASVMVNRAELLAMLEELRQALPGSLAQAQELIGDREQMVEQARQEAERIIGQAHAERGSLISDTEVARRSQAEADRILNEARQEAEEVRAEADDYVDSKLANFEVVLTKTLGSVGRGREKLLGTGPGVDENGYEDEDAPERSHDPETLRKDADSYVDAKLGAFEAVLAKTLEAVGRGRQKLHGRIATDDLGALADDTSTVQHSSDADYLADLTALAEQDARTQARGQSEQPDYTQQPHVRLPAAERRLRRLSPAARSLRPAGPVRLPAGRSLRLPGLRPAAVRPEPGPAGPAGPAEPSVAAELRPGRDQPLRHRHDHAGAVEGVRAGSGPVGEHRIGP